MNVYAGASGKTLVLKGEARWMSSNNLPPENSGTRGLCRAKYEIGGFLLCSKDRITLVESQESFSSLFDLVSLRALAFFIWEAW